MERNYIKIGVAGPVGSGKTALIERLCRQMFHDYSIAVITNDIYTKKLPPYKNHSQSANKNDESLGGDACIVRVFLFLK